MENKIHIKSFNEATENLNITENQLNEIILHLDEYGTMTDKYCFGLPTGEEDMKQMRELIIGVLKNLT